MAAVLSEEFGLLDRFKLNEDAGKCFDAGDTVIIIAYYQNDSILIQNENFLCTRYVSKKYLSLLEHFAGKLPEFNVGTRVLIKRSIAPYAVFEKGEHGVITELMPNEARAYVKTYSYRVVNWVTFNDLELRVVKPPIAVDPKDIIVDGEPEDIWNPYPFKEKVFYGAH
jgi:hypothetical protein